MRSRVRIALAVAALSLVIGVTAGGAAPQRLCHVRGAEAVRVSKDARVERRAEGRVKRVYYGCYRSTRSRRIAVGESVGGVGYIKVELAGRYVAFLGQEDHRDGALAFMRLVDLKTGAVRQKEPLNGYGTGNFILGRDGRVVFCVRWLGRVWIYAFGTRTERLIAEGADIKASSVARAGNTVYWTDSSGPRSSRVPGWT